MPQLNRKGYRFLICIENYGLKVSLEKRKIHIALPDAITLKHDQVRVIDESGEDYLYPKSLFLPITVPTSLRKAILKAAQFSEGVRSLCSLRDGVGPHSRLALK